MMPPVLTASAEGAVSAALSLRTGGVVGMVNSSPEVKDGVSGEASEWSDAAGEAGRVATDDRNEVRRPRSHRER